MHAPGAPSSTMRSRVSTNKETRTSSSETTLRPYVTRTRVVYAWLCDDHKNKFNLTESYIPQDMMVKHLRMVEKILEHHFDIVPLKLVISNNGLRIENLRHESTMLSKPISIRHRDDDVPSNPRRSFSRNECDPRKPDRSQLVVYHGARSVGIIGSPFIQQLSSGIY